MENEECFMLEDDDDDDVSQIFQQNPIDPFYLDQVGAGLEVIIRPIVCIESVFS